MTQGVFKEDYNRTSQRKKIGQEIAEFAFPAPILGFKCHALGILGAASLLACFFQ